MMTTRLIPAAAALAALILASHQAAAQDTTPPAGATAPAAPQVTPAPAPTLAPTPAPDAREKGVIIRRDPVPDPKAQAETAAPRKAERAKRPVGYAARRKATRTARRYPRYRVDPAAAAFAEIASTIVGGVLTVFGEPYGYDYTYGYPVLVRPRSGYDYTYGPRRAYRW